MSTNQNPFSPFGFLRIAVCAPELQVAAVEFNVGKIVEAIREAGKEGVQLALFPELCLTGYTCADLFYQRSLRERALDQMADIKETCKAENVGVVVGLPVVSEGHLFNSACLIGADGKIAGLVPKTYLPNTNEFYEARWFTRGDFGKQKLMRVGQELVPFGCDLLFPVEGSPDCVIGIEVCEDLWAINPPSGFLAAAGASVILNPSASNEVLGKKSYRAALVAQQSARCLAVYAYASAGPGESSTDVVYSGHCLIAENGQRLAETPRFRFESTMAVADADLDKITHERIKNSSFAQTSCNSEFRAVPITLAEWKGDGLRRQIDPHPFVPKDKSQRTDNCREIISIQSTGLAKRLRHTGAKNLTVGISGGLDSTLAILVAVHAFDLLGLPRSGILALTMPGFGTTARTKGNADKLAEMLGISLRQIPIIEAVSQHLRDIGQLEGLHDITFENAQARERTQILMNLANQTGGFVLGTGDLSELALGWCTFNGDHRSMYHVNAGVPKTLVRYLIEWCAEDLFQGEIAATLLDISQTPISPELLPPTLSGEIKQKTEDVVGPYELHDFFLFHTVRNGYPTHKIFFLAELAFKNTYETREIRKWLELFSRRFYSQQITRSAMPDGPKVGSVALSPRGDWRMPSDAVGSAFS